MIPACFATLLWSVCVIASRRSLEQIGEIPANFWRMVIAVLCLGLVSHAGNALFETTPFFYLFLSGAVGFGFGDIALYCALSRIGSRLTILIAQCGAVPIAFFIEWQCLGNLISWSEAGAIVVILIGIILALLPRKGFLHIGNRKHFALGVFFGLIAALGQGAGGVLSRMAYQAQSSAVMPANTLDGILLGASAGYQRLLGGLLVIGLVYFVSKTCFTRKSQLFYGRGDDSTANKFSWLLLAALTGPVIGIIFFQWALFVTEAAIAQAIVALTPIVIIPLAYWIEGERPSPRSILGGIIAVCGVILLMLT